MLFVPRPPEFVKDGDRQSGSDKEEMKVLEQGSDVIPAHTTKDTTEKHYRLVSIGKKVSPTLREPEVGGRRHFGGR